MPQFFVFWCWLLPQWWWLSWTLSESFCSDLCRAYNIHLDLTPLTALFTFFPIARKERQNRTKSGQIQIGTRHTMVLSESADELQLALHAGFDYFITLTWQWARLRLKSPASPLFTQPYILAQINENIKVPCHWPLCGEFTGHRWIQ